MGLIKKIKKIIAGYNRKQASISEFNKPLDKKYTYLKELPFVICTLPFIGSLCIVSFISLPLIFDFDRYDKKLETKVKFTPQILGLNLEETILTNKSLLKNEVNLELFMKEHMGKNGEKYIDESILSYRENLKNSNIKENEIHYFIEKTEDETRYYSTDKFGVIGSFYLKTSKKEYLI